MPPSVRAMGPARPAGHGVPAGTRAVGAMEGADGRHENASAADGERRAAPPVALHGRTGLRGPRAERADELGGVARRVHHERVAQAGAVAVLPGDVAVAAPTLR